MRSSSADRDLYPPLGSASWSGDTEWETLRASGASHKELRRHALASPGGWDPDVAVFRRGDTVIIRADLPGVCKECLKVELEDDVLMIAGGSALSKDANGVDHHRSERNHGTFFRAIPLPEGTDTEQCDATFKDGVLEVHFSMPPGEQHKRKSIEVH